VKLFWFGVLGLLVQGVSLAAFMLVSRSSVAAVGKPAIIVIAGLVICTLLWEGVRRSKGILAFCLLPVLLALGYDVAFHLLGVLGFPGLLSDSRQPWLDYVLPLLHVTVTLLILYGLATALFFVISRGFRRIRPRGHQQCPKLL
jgi:hypothetical protein